MIYADYQYYQEVFKGSVIPSETDFDSKALKASAFVDKVTFGRAKDNGQMEEVKNAMCAVAEVMYQNDAHYGVSSENNDGYSVTFINNSTKEMRDLKRAAYLFLPANLIYRGC